jgi:hypothetical protein
MRLTIWFLMFEWVCVSCSPKITTHSYSTIETDTVYVEVANDSIIFETIIDNEALDSALFELARAVAHADSLNLPLEPEILRIYRERIVKQASPDTTFYFSHDLIGHNKDTTIRIPLKIAIHKRGNVYTHKVSVEAFQIPYTSKQETWTMNIERLNAWSRWLMLIIVVGGVIFVIKKVIL